MILTIVPGIDGSDADHWQTAWQAATGAVRIRPASWDQPDLEDWVAAIDVTVRQAGDTILVAHSLGCLAASVWLSRNPGQVRGALLVAPPDRFAGTFPAAAPSFRSLDPVPLGSPALLVASEDDPYCDPAAARALADAWGADLVSVGNLGHINNRSNIGGWPQGRALFADFQTTLTDRPAVPTLNEATR